MTEQVDQLHNNNASAYSTALMQALLAKRHINQVCQPPYSPDLAPKIKIAIEREEICEWDSHTVHKLSQRRLTANLLAPRESDFKDAQ